VKPKSFCLKIIAVLTALTFLTTSTVSFADTAYLQEVWQNEVSHLRTRSIADAPSLAAQYFGLKDSPVETIDPTGFNAYLTSGISLVSAPPIVQTWHSELRDFAFDLRNAERLEKNQRKDFKDRYALFLKKYGSVIDNIFFFLMIGAGALAAMWAFNRNMGFVKVMIAAVIAAGPVGILGAFVTKGKNLRRQEKDNDQSQFHSELRTSNAKAEKRTQTAKMALPAKYKTIWGFGSILLGALIALFVISYFPNILHSTLITQGADSVAEAAGIAIVGLSIFISFFILKHVIKWVSGNQYHIQSEFDGFNDRHHQSFMDVQAFLSSHVKNPAQAPRQYEVTQALPVRRDKNDEAWVFFSEANGWIDENSFYRVLGIKTPKENTNDERMEGIDETGQPVWVIRKPGRILLAYQPVERTGDVLRQVTNLFLRLREHRQWDFTLVWHPRSQTDEIVLVPKMRRLPSLKKNRFRLARSELREVNAQQQVDQIHRIRQWLDRFFLLSAVLAGLITAAIFTAWGAKLNWETWVFSALVSFGVLVIGYRVTQRYVKLEKVLQSLPIQVVKFAWFPGFDHEAYGSDFEARLTNAIFAFLNSMPEAVELAFKTDRESSPLWSLENEVAGTPDTFDFHTHIMSNPRHRQLQVAVEKTNGGEVASVIVRLDHFHPVQIPQAAQPNSISQRSENREVKSSLSVSMPEAVLPQSNIYRGEGESAKKSAAFAKYVNQELDFVRKRIRSILAVLKLKWRAKQSLVLESVIEEFSKLLMNVHGDIDRFKDGGSTYQALGTALITISDRVVLAKNHLDALEWRPVFKEAYSRLAEIEDMLGQLFALSDPTNEADLTDDESGLTFSRPELRKNEESLKVRARAARRAIKQLQTDIAGELKRWPAVVEAVLTRIDELDQKVEQGLSITAVEGDLESSLGVDGQLVWTVQAESLIRSLGQEADYLREIKNELDAADFTLKRLPREEKGFSPETVQALERKQKLLSAKLDQLRLKVQSIQSVQKSVSAVIRLLDRVIEAYAEKSAAKTELRLQATMNDGELAAEWADRLFGINESSAVSSQAGVLISRYALADYGNPEPVGIILQEAAKASTVRLAVAATDSIVRDLVKRVNQTLPEAKQIIIGRNYQEAAGLLKAEGASYVRVIASESERGGLQEQLLRSIGNDVYFVKRGDLQSVFHFLGVSESLINAFRNELRLAYAA